MLNVLFIYESKKYIDCILCEVVFYFMCSYYNHFNRINSHKQYLFSSQVSSIQNFICTGNMEGQQFCLRWHNFQNTLLSSLPKLLDGGYLTDVTLSAGGRNIQAHRIILSACSYYFKELFKVFIINFIYICMLIYKLINIIYQFITRDRQMT